MPCQEGTHMRALKRGLAGVLLGRVHRHRLTKRHAVNCGQSVDMLSTVDNLPTCCQLRVSADTGLKGGLHRVDHRRPMSELHTSWVRKRKEWSLWVTGGQ
eukprot:1158022-Pelagomonas_calceolata.AAC.10